MLALRCVLRTLPMIAALSASHLTAQILPKTIGRIYIAQDNDEAGTHAARSLADRAKLHHGEPVMLRPRARDFDDDLRQIGSAELAAWVRVQLVPNEVAYLPATLTG
jgi:DNA primase